MCSIDIENYYIKTKTTYIIDGNPYEVILSSYVFGSLVINQVELPNGSRYQYQAEYEISWEPELDIDLLFSNYELRLSGYQTLAGHECMVIDIYRKRSRQLAYKYLIDQETKLHLAEYKYGLRGELISFSEILEFNFDPDISQFDLKNIPKVNLTTQHFPMSQEQFQARMPWIDLSALPLPRGYKIVGYSQAILSQDLLNTEWLYNTYVSYPVNYLWIWTSDGIENCIIKIGYVPNKMISLSPDLGLNVIYNDSTSTLVTVPNNPISIEVSGEFMTAEQRIVIIQALTSIERINNIEALDMSYTPTLREKIAIDYTQIPKKSMTLEKFEEELPWIYTGTYAIPQGYKIVGFAKVEYPEDIKQALDVYQLHPNAPIRDYVIIISNGRNYHYIGVSDGTKDGVIRQWQANLRVHRASAALTLIEHPISVYSSSDFLTVEEQLQMLFALFWAFEVPTL